MPQMSPMNWIYISLMFISLYSILKMNLNTNFKSKNNQKIQLNSKKINISW